jgi:DNA (cytosine-5)-methyltransferase 1
MGFQTNLLEEIIVDNFAGGGGASTGIELATGRPVTIAVNHDPAAILMHKTNHPYTEHYQASVWDIDPKEVCRGRKVALAWFSPDCKHFSKAKGGKPVDKNIRGLAWIVLRWASQVKPRVIILENVEEFQTWGPVRKGKPIKSKSGETFNRWLSQLKSLGYEVEYRELRACDYGAPTIRKRFFLVARCDGKPIVFPEPTHGPADSPEVKSGKLKPYRTAAECIDFSVDCPSIFNRKKPLVENTLRRIARGLDKFVIQNSDPFIIPIGYGENKNQKPRVHDINAPLSTIVSSGKQYFCTPYMSPIGHTGFCIDRNYSVEKPLQTIVSKNEQTLISPYFSTLKFSNDCSDIKTPLTTICSVNCHYLLAPSLIQYHSETAAGEVRGQKLDMPILTVDGSNRYALQIPFLQKYFGGVVGADVKEPTPTVTAIDHNALTTPYLTKYYSSGDNIENVLKPLPTVTAKDRMGLSLPFLTQYYSGKDHANTVLNPLQTVTVQPRHFLCKTYLKKYSKSMCMGNWEKVRKILNEYTDWNIADDEILIFNINNTEYFICDIGLRMLQPKELYAAQGFPSDYIIDRDYQGNEYKKTKQIARCGNAVPPPFAKALVEANLPELCIDGHVDSMQHLKEKIAV